MAHALRALRSQIINLLVDLQEKHGLTYLFIAHDLTVVRHISDRVAVMRSGRIVEIDLPQRLFVDPQHSYTRALIAATPVFRSGNEEGTPTKPT